MIANLDHGIVVDISITPVKQYKSETIYDLYLKFNLSQHGIAQKPATFKLEKQVNVCDWDQTVTKVKGTGKAVVEINNKLKEYPVDAKRKIERHFTNVRTFTYRNVREYIKTKLRSEFTGDAPVGQKETFQQSQDAHTIDAVCGSYLSFKQIGKVRQRQYPRSMGYLHQYFNEVKKEKTPLITQITKFDMKGFAIWFTKKLKTKKGKPFKPSARATTLSQIAAVFEFACEDLEIIPFKPIPKKFRGKVPESKERKALNDKEFADVMNLKGLSQPLRRAVLCFCIQGKTGMDYIDLKNLREKHFHFDELLGTWLIKKNREKTGELFIVPASQTVIDAMEELKHMTPGQGDLLLKLPSTEYTIRQFKELAKLAQVAFNFTTKTMRHTFATAMVNAGVPLNVVQIMLGHADPRQTAPYSRIDESTLQDAMAKASKSSGILK